MKQSCLKFAIAAIGAFSLITLSACSSEEPAVSSTPPTSEKSDIRSVEDACNIALAFLEAGNDISASRSEDAIANVKIGYGATSRSGAADTLFYSVNLANDGGFVLVSAPTAAEPVLAYVENGSYDPAQPSDNPGFNLFIEKSKEYTSLANTVTAIGGPITVDKPYSIVRHAEPSLKVNWGQEFPEGMFCPNGISGCVQTAMAQILSYFEQPTKLELTYPERDRDLVVLNWTEIKKHINSCSDSLEAINIHIQNCEASEESHKSLAYLCRELGYRNNADYDKSVTGALSSDANSVYKELLPTRTVTDYSPFNSSCFDNLISKMVSHKAVAHFRGRGKTFEGAHAWVCEGGRHYEHHTRILYANGEEYIKNEYYFYFNWGKDGERNGYFLGDVYDPSKALQKEDLPPTLDGFTPFSRSGYSENVHYYMIY